MGPLAWPTPRAILSRRFEGGIGPLKGWDERRRGSVLNIGEFWKGESEEWTVITLESNKTSSMLPLDFHVLLHIVSN